MMKYLLFTMLLFILSLTFYGQDMDVDSLSSPGDYIMNSVVDLDPLNFKSLKDERGEELWYQLNDSTEVFIKDINKGHFGSKPHGFVKLNDYVFFIAHDRTHGDELYRTDGSDTGTVMMMDIMHGPGVGSDISDLTIYNGLLFFVATDWKHGKELWCTDGTIEGTRMVKDIHKGKTGSFPGYLTILNNTLYFVTDEWDSEKKLWKTDGSKEGTIVIGDFKQELAKMASKEAKNLQLFLSLPSTRD